MFVNYYGSVTAVLQMTLPRPNKRGVYRIEDWEFNPHTVITVDKGNTKAMGNVQVLPNGNFLVCMGTNNALREFDG